MKKSKLFKTISFSSLALLIGIAGTMAFAPIGTTTTPIANASEISTESGGLITPKKDDPVIYTTESGIDIKWSNYSFTVTNGNQVGGVASTGASLPTGNLTGFPYFVTNDGTTDYTWVIIGKASDVGTSIGSNVFSGYQYNTLTNWQTLFKENEFVQYHYFFNNVWDETTPAGNSIKSDNTLNDVSAFTALANMPITLNSYVVTDTRGEIPSGCVLVIANECTQSGVRNTSSAYYSVGSYYYYTYHTTWVGSMRTVMENYYNTPSLGLDGIKPHIVPVTLTTFGKVATGSASWGNSTQVVENCYVYTLSGTSTDTFYALNYLTAAQASLSIQWWLRGGNSTGYTAVSVNSSNYNYYIYAHSMSTAGAVTHSMYCNNTSGGYRPAFCLKVV